MHASTGAESQWPARFDVGDRASCNSQRKDSRRAPIESSSRSPENAPSASRRTCEARASALSAKRRRTAAAAETALSAAARHDFGASREEGGPTGETWFPP